VHVHDRFLSVDGLRLRYREWGDTSSPPVVLLHGGSAHAHWWDSFAAAIADTYRVLALDLRGHGDSDHVDPPAYRIGDYTRDLAQFVEVMALGRFDLIGHSLGGMVATAYAGLAPQHLNSLVVVDSQLRITPGGAHYMLQLHNFPQTFYRDREQAIRRFRLLPPHTQADAATLAHVAAHGIRQLPDGRWTLKFDRESLAHAEPQDLTPILRCLTCPVLFVRGAHSTLLPHERLAALLDAVPHAESVEIAAAHHHVMLDNPPAFERAVRAFLDTVHRRTARVVSMPASNP
ncbi:MAG TPA: alpha/beta hydrolase, partial [Candidatus Acidoferrales bacterium]|nr:alpha/beta hydrolase [Candidatus Acidoferrales bacterium]